MATKPKAKTPDELYKDALNAAIQSSRDAAKAAMDTTASSYDYINNQNAQDTKIAQDAQAQATNAVIQQARGQLQGIGGVYTPGTGGGVVNPNVANARRQAVNSSNAELAWQAGEQVAGTQPATAFDKIGSTITQGGWPLSSGMGNAAMTSATGDLYRQANEAARASQGAQIGLISMQNEQNLAAAAAADAAKRAYEAELLRRDQAFTAQQNELNRRNALAQVNARSTGSDSLTDAEKAQIVQAQYVNGKTTILGNKLQNTLDTNAGMVNVTMPDSKGVTTTFAVNIGDKAFGLIAAAGETVGQSEGVKLERLTQLISGYSQAERIALSTALFGVPDAAYISPNNLLPFINTYVAPAPGTQGSQTGQPKSGQTKQPQNIKTTPAQDASTASRLLTELAQKLALGGGFLGK